MSENGNNIASAADFRKMRDFDPTECVVLPKLGKAVLLRRPTPLWFALRGHLPTTLASKVDADTEKPQTVTEDLRQVGEWWYMVLRDIMVQPRVSLEPGPEEISPDMIDMEDAAFIYEWAYGIRPTKDAGQGGTEAAKDLGEFRPQQKLPDAGADGRDVEMPAVRTPR